MDRLEKELSRLRKLHTVFGRKDIGNRPELLSEDEAGNDNVDRNKHFPMGHCGNVFLISC